MWYHSLVSFLSAVYCPPPSYSYADNDNTYLVSVTFHPPLEINQIILDNDMMTTKTPSQSQTSPPSSSDSLSWFASIATSSSSSLSEAQPADEQQQKLLQSPSPKRTSSSSSNNNNSPNKWRKYKRICKVPECTNQVVKGDVCIRHGARRKLCTYIKDGVQCTSYAHKGGVCTLHGAKKKRCIGVGCTNQARRGGLCRHHGAYRQEQQPATTKQQQQT